MRRYLKHELRPPHLIHAPTDERDEEDCRLLMEVRLLLRDYWPHPVLEFSGYLSTFWSGFWAALPTAAIPGQRVEELVLGDGGTVSLHWCQAPERGLSSKGDASRKTIALVLPGLNNDSRTSFIQETMAHLRDEGFHAVTLNYRGTSGLELTSPRIGCLDSWRDLPEVVAHLEARHPDAQLSAVGFSMGGAILLRHLGVEGANARFHAAVTIAAPMDVPGVVVALEATWKKRGINFFMANGVKMFMGHAIHKSPLLHNLPKGRLWRAMSVRHVDEATVCPLHGYRDADDYYTSNDPRPILGKIEVPTLMVNAEDDPVVSVMTIPIDEARKNPRLYLALTKRGGHIGWGSGGLGAECWTDSMAVRFLRACGTTWRPSVARPPWPAPFRAPVCADTPSGFQSRL